ncbi:hypothetical protein PHYBLDRAFT_163618 [Phycomyces blakesleeanus NRRL 1555(-)]|uniref:Uncharacterized protein n=1 Tax=Phycomyces blakesleeanus (strain ATCC 8743b / DSM 1359 / FGSC 10004 / NBRC 33097 / NRRL 1555) TaxID=763407 RepID=A0A167PTH0_PHYB8|nr:hypothetical protein PHYBLDRAFT_163618 [Phycomyces blakesleeanus NRRL 1555(-)]OAD78508.1 hypothetical protein PHYBLDRAFT_163618 [Phycomyces blakesleeanus NRRL 1555(-)]|eukprot:XP_018296548.1 hypothetical protein PHYBLDRAFT_163618 [Phycomyces blakesleeanus NRRL 1555(-)]
MNITREQAIYILFSKEYDEENVARLLKKIADFGSFDICYEVDPRKPIMPINTASELQVIPFLNEVHATIVYTPNESAYYLKRFTTNVIYELVITTTDSMCKKSEAAFATCLASRDINERPNLLAELMRVDGNTQGTIPILILNHFSSMISYISATEQNICIVALDFAGPSTDFNDLHSFVSHKVHVFQREEILNDPSGLYPFNFRSKSIQRFKIV